MKVSVSAFVWGMALVLGAGMAHAKNPATASMIFGMQISESIGSIPLQLEDVNGRYSVTGVSTANCRTTFTAGGKSWTADWRSDLEFQRGNTNLLLMLTDKGPVGISGAGKDDADTAYKAAFDKAQNAMEYLWGNCS